MIDAKFKKMNKARRRVALARDVLAQLNAKKITSEMAGYFDIGTDFKNNGGSIPFSPRRQLRNLAKGKKCTVCAIGALFKSKLDKVNELKVGDLENVSRYKDNRPVVNRSDVLRYLEDTFCATELVQIESYFEKSTHIASKWAEYSERDDRMRLIMENIIVNKGTFDPILEPVLVEMESECVGKYVTVAFKK